MALYELTEFSAYIQRDDVNETTATLLRDLVTGVIEAAVTIPDPVPTMVKAVALTAAARAYNNPQGLVTETIGAYSYSRNQGERRTGVYLTDEEREQVITAVSGVAGGAYSIDTTPTTALSGHQDYCSINFGATYCSCGYVLTDGLYYP